MFHTQVEFNLFRIDRRRIDLVPSFRQPHGGRLGLLACLIILLTPYFAPRAAAQESSEASIAAYADAANFQTNGAIALAIEAWQTFLREYPKDPMASKAAHFLGVCYMQQESPDYVAAARSFAQALQDPDYDLREESLINQGWCLYASAGEAPNRDQDRLRASIQSFKTLRKEYPQSTFLDRALFYSGEAAYGLGDAKQAIANYDQLLALPQAKESPLRCDALYARGIAYEELDQFDNAVASFRQLLSSCPNSDLVTDVHLRIGDTAILNQDYEQAIESFDAAFESTDKTEDRSYAIFRQAFALVQANQPGEAAKKYEQLLEDYPDSRYTAAATLASAQSTYRSGDLDEAAQRFQRVLKQNNSAASTEAAHWLARIYLRKGDPAKAIEVARRQLDRGAEGKFVVTLKLDLAEALSMNPETLEASLEAFETTYRDAPQD
ncbi:MAG: tetratricopeptide repeat protein, partial [Novipirellula sp. JB048]